MQTGKESVSGGKPSKSIWQILILQQLDDNNNKIQEIFHGVKNFQFINGNGIKSITLRVPEYVDTFPNCVTLPAPPDRSLNAKLSSEQKLRFQYFSSGGCLE